MWLQYAIVGAIVIVALWVFAKKQLPGTLRKARLALAAPLVREGRPAWMRALARRIAPPGRGSATLACGGCDNDSCDPGPKQH
ncbi:DUF6587 family protein [Pseudoxanthomonas koreensis]|uniref:DUF6587 family protein n=1 Tax=Pseudoxanthomonas koreensis TaxID=266061 RepID=UPI001391C281|nr:DUF6587 family protein [Pseudoxanthomonas koreensis]